MPDWIDYGKSFADFRNEGLGKPGTLIDIADMILLIGHINELRGVCDHCKHPNLDPFGRDIVKRYRVVWKED